MKVAVLHYHLRPGGISRTVSTTFRNFHSGSRAVFFTGEVPETDFPGDVPVALMHGMEEEVDAKVDPKDLARRMIQRAEATLGTQPDVWHVFNHTVGKNVIVPRTVAELAKAGQRLLLHIADFPEDGRPAAYHNLRENNCLKTLYPMGIHVHYGVSNRRDYLYMLQLGVSEFQLHYVPNPVAPVIPTAPPPEDDSFLLYATRAVRRKNLGELLLSAAAHGGRYRYGVTLPPNRGASDLWAYYQWERLTEELKLPVAFNLGILPDTYFPNLIEQSAAAVTTSVAEGFGLSFLEPWLAGRPVTGRALPEVITEFGSVGIELEHLYEHLHVPIEWIGADRLRRHVVNQWRRTLETYGRSPDPDDYERIAAHWQSGDCVDFGFLDEELQIPIIKRVRQDPAAAAIVRAQLPDTTVHPDTIRANGAQIRQLFSPTAYGQRIQGIYRRIAATAPDSVEFLDPDAVLSKFLQPERFLLLRAVR